MGLEEEVDRVKRKQLTNHLTLAQNDKKFGKSHHTLLEMDTFNKINGA